MTSSPSLRSSPTDINSVTIASGLVGSVHMGGSMKVFKFSADAISLSVDTVTFGSFFIRDLQKNRFKHEKANPITSGIIGGIAYFFNTLGIGSYATSTAMLRSTKQIGDKNLPGTLNVTSVLPELTGAFIFISIIKVDPFTITCMVAATCIGCWTGAGTDRTAPCARSARRVHRHRTRSSAVRRW